MTHRPARWPIFFGSVRSVVLLPFLDDGVMVDLFQSFTFFTCDYVFEMFVWLFTLRIPPVRSWPPKRKLAPITFFLRRTQAILLLPKMAPV